MNKSNSFSYIGNMQNGACLLFDRKGLSCFPPKNFDVTNFIKNIFAAETQRAQRKDLGLSLREQRGNPVLQCF